MLDFTFTQIVIASLLSLAGGGGTVKLIQIAIAQINLIRERRRLVRGADITDAAEVRKATGENKRLDEQSALAEIWRLYDEAKNTIKELEDEARRVVKDANNSHSLSRPTLQKAYAHLRQAQRLVSQLEDMVAREDPHSELAIKVEQLRLEIDQMEKDLP